MSGARTTLRWRLTLVYGAVAIAVGLALLFLSVYLVNRALLDGRLNVPNAFVPLPGGRVLALDTYQEQLRKATLSRLTRQGFLVLLVIGAIGIGIGYLLAGRVLRPLQQITSTAQRLSAEQLDARIALPGPEDELKQLADTFDAMLDRLQASFEAQRRFVADASHELRTPLAVMRTEVDVALADPDATADDLRAAALVVRDATMRADRLVDSLLLLARSDRLAVDGLPLRERVELPEVSAAALAAVAREAEERHIVLTSSYAPAAVYGDRGLLERLAGNLVENGVRHNVLGGEVRVTVRPGLVHVENTGPEIRLQDVRRLAEPFERLHRDSTGPGAGLGLSIVRAVADAHGARLELAPRAGGGLLAEVGFTAPRPAAHPPAGARPALA
jgi:signal transduction histidine kinase